MKKKKNTKLGLKSLFLPFLTGAVIGGVIAAIVIYQTKDKGGIQISLLYMAMAFFFLAAGFFLQIIFHEAGHGLFGYASGFRFVSFRIGSWIGVRENGKIKIKRFNVPGTGGQCLMMPPETDLFNCPYKWYNMGGILMNGLVTLLFVVILTGTWLDGYSKLFVIMLIISGFIVLITNGIPMKLSGITNDAYNIILLSKDHLSRYAFGLQLKIYGLQTQGKRLKEMPQEWFILPSKPDFTNIFHVTLYLLKAMWYMERLNFEQARNILSQIEPHENKIIPLLGKEWKCEFLFCEIICGENPEKIKMLYSPELEKYCLESGKYMLNKKRMMYAYALLAERDGQKAEKIRKDFLKLASRYPNPGEATAEAEIMEEIRCRNALPEAFSRVGVKE